MKHLTKTGDLIHGESSYQILKSTRHRASPDETPSDRFTGSSRSLRFSDDRVTEQTDATMATVQIPELNDGFRPEIRQKNIHIVNYFIVSTR